MQRLYYLASDVDITERVSEALHGEGIRDWNFHVLSKDEAGLYIHRVHSATPFQQLDLIHSAARWGIGGGALGLAIGLVCWVFQLLPWQTSTLTVAVLTLLGVFYGAWEGGMVGLSRENYKIAPFHDDIEAGRYLIMIDVRREHRSRVHELMQTKFPAVLRCGSTSTLINPFERPVRMHHQNTH